MHDSIGGFIWYELMTSDADAAARFYGRVIGWTIGPAAKAAAGTADYRMIERADGGFAGGVLQLTSDMVSQGAHPTWLGYLCVADVDDSVRAIVADGGRVLMPRTDLPVGAIAMVTDPLGQPFYVMAPIPPAGKPEAKSDVFDPTAAQRVRWNELASPDLARAKSFYAKHFGFAFNESMPMGAAGDYCFIDLGGQRLGAIMQRSADAPVGSWLFYFGVASIRAAHAAIEAGGGRVVNGPHEVPG
ncbi:MAG: VOC family protein, partial [Gammaproteobacteria bacterium]|nr:VOC family protein [Gammaproteobacteria bacterium]